MNDSKMVCVGLLIQSLAILANAQAPAPTPTPTQDDCFLKRSTFEKSNLSDDLKLDEVTKEISEASERYVNALGANSPVKADIVKYVNACEMLKAERKDLNIPVTSAKDEFIKKQYQKHKKLTDTSELCLSGILYALEHEKTVVKESKSDQKCTKDKLDESIVAVDKDISFMKKLNKMNDENVSALSKEIDPDAPVKNFTSAQLKEIEESGNFSDVASTKPYYSVLEAGISFMPEYDAEGKNQGFKESNLFAILRLNNRKEIEFPRHDSLVFYQELDVAFYSAPIACLESDSGAASSAGSGAGSGAASSAGSGTGSGTASSAGSGAGTGTASSSASQTSDNCIGKDTDVTKLKFRDVSNTVNASVYGSIMYRNSSMLGDWEIGNSIRYGVLNRDAKGPDGDSVATFYNYGFELRLNDFLGQKRNAAYLNGMPKFMINYSEGKNEDFAGAGVKTKRKIASFNYRIFDNQPVFIGLIVDGGKGPDTIALNISYGLKASSIFGLFAD